MLIFFRSMIDCHNCYLANPSSKSCRPKAFAKSLNDGNTPIAWLRLISLLPSDITNFHKSMARKTQTIIEQPNLLDASTTLRTAVCVPFIQQEVEQWSKGVYKDKLKRFAYDVNGVHWLLETKGREDPYVIFKNQRAEKWCEDVTNLTGIEWKFQIIKQRDFAVLKPQMLSDLIGSLTAGGLLIEI